MSTANSLTTARSIALSGAATGSSMFDGSQNITIDTILANTYVKTVNNQVPDINGNITITLSGGTAFQSSSDISIVSDVISLTPTGITPGIYSTIQVDAKGRVIAGTPVLI